MKFKLRYLRYLAILFLWLFLARGLINSINRLNAKRTTFATSTDENKFQWPLFTVCPMSYVDNYVESFDHIMDNIKVAKDNFE